MHRQWCITFRIIFGRASFSTPPTIDSSESYQGAENFRDFADRAVFTLATAEIADQYQNHKRFTGHVSIAHRGRRFPRITAWLH
jgi:hypothetical protein